MPGRPGQVNQTPTSTNYTLIGLTLQNKLHLVYTIPMPSYLWDFDKEELEKTEEGRIFILERKINYGPDGEKIKLSDVKKYWDKMQLWTPQRRLLELLIWGTSQSLPSTNSMSWIK